MCTRLQPDIVPVMPIGYCHQFLVRSLFLYLTLLQEINSVGVGYGRLMMGDNDDQPVLRRFMQGVDEIGLGFGIQRGSRFIEDQNTCIP